MSRNEYLELVKKEVVEKYPQRDIALWEDTEWQEIINEMYDDFNSYSHEKQEALITAAGPKESFWKRAVGDGAYAYHMWA